MQWVPSAQTLSDFKAHVRSFVDVFPEVIVAEGPGKYSFYMLGSAEPMTLDQASLSAILSRPGVVRDISSAFDSPESTLDGWLARIPTLVRVSGGDVQTFAGQGPLVTDDRPIPEYFLLHRLFGDSSPRLKGGDVHGAGRQ